MQLVLTMRAMKIPLLLGGCVIGEIARYANADALGDCAECLADATMDCLQVCYGIIDDVDGDTEECCTWWTCSPCPQDVEEQKVPDSGTTTAKVATTTKPIATKTTVTTTTGDVACTYDYQGDACMNATASRLNNNQGGYFKSSYSGLLDGVYLVYLNGSVSCNKATGDAGTNWGCRESVLDLATFIVREDTTPEAYDILVPLTQLDWFPGYYAADKSKGRTVNAPTLYFPLPADSRAEVEEGEGFYLAYGETVMQWVPEDNAGITCAAIYWKYGGGDCPAPSLDTALVTKSSLPSPGMNPSPATEPMPELTFPAPAPAPAPESTTTRAYWVGRPVPEPAVDPHYYD